MSGQGPRELNLAVPPGISRFRFLWRTIRNPRLEPRRSLMLGALSCIGHLPPPDQGRMRRLGRARGREGRSGCGRARSRHLPASTPSRRKRSRDVRSARTREEPVPSRRRGCRRAGEARGPVASLRARQGGPRSGRRWSRGPRPTAERRWPGSRRRDTARQFAGCGATWRGASALTMLVACIMAAPLISHATSARSYSPRCQWMKACTRV